MEEIAGVNLLEVKTYLIDPVWTVIKYFVPPIAWFLFLVLGSVWLLGRISIGLSKLCKTDTPVKAFDIVIMTVVVIFTVGVARDVTQWFLGTGKRR